MKQLKSQNIKIMMGDFNSKVGSERVEHVVGHFGMGEKNERGYRLIEFCKEHIITLGSKITQEKIGHGKAQ